MSDQDDFKENLFQNFKENGLLDNLKTQMRSQLIEKLKKQTKLQLDKDQTSDDQNKLSRRLASSLVADFLQQKEMNYTQQIFHPESGFNGQILAGTEIKEILNFSKRFDNYNNKLSLLENIVDLFLDQKPQDHRKTNCSTQTEIVDQVANLEDQLKMVDDQFHHRVKQEMLRPTQEVEERMTQFQKDYENRMKAEMNAEITRIREFEISAIRMDEAEKYRNQMQEYREELEKGYMEKLNRLRDREKETLQKCSRKMKEIQSVNSSHRQSILKDFQLLSLRQNELEKQKALNQDTLQVEKMKMEALQRDLKGRLKEVESLQSNFQRKTDQEVLNAKMRLTNEFQMQRGDFIEKKRHLDQDLYQIDQMKDTLTNFTAENRKLIDENHQIMDENQDLKRQKKELQNELTEVREQLRSLTEMLNRQQHQNQTQEELLKMKDTEITNLKKFKDTFDELLNKHKDMNNEIQRNFNFEKQKYQETIEKLQEQNQKLKEEVKETLPPSNYYQSQAHMGSMSGTNTTLIPTLYQQPMRVDQSFFVNDFDKRINGLHEEMGRLKQIRQEEILNFKQESDFVGKQNYLKKFDSVWDPTNSAVQFSQMPQMGLQSLQKHDDLNSHDYNTAGFGEKPQILERVDFTQSVNQESNIFFNNNNNNYNEFTRKPSNHHLPYQADNNQMNNKKQGREGNIIEEVLHEENKFEDDHRDNLGESSGSYSQKLVTEIKDARKIQNSSPIQHMYQNEKEQEKQRQQEKEDKNKKPSFNTPSTQPIDIFQPSSKDTHDGLNRFDKEKEREKDYGFQKDETLKKKDDPFRIQDTLQKDDHHDPWAFNIDDHDHKKPSIQPIKETNKLKEIDFPIKQKEQEVQDHQPSTVKPLAPLAPLNPVSDNKFGQAPSALPSLSDHQQLPEVEKKPIEQKPSWLSDEEDDIFQQIDQPKEVSKNLIPPSNNNNKPANNSFLNNKSKKNDSPGQQEPIEEDFDFDEIQL